MRSQRIYTERRRRGFFGTLFLVIFWGWNALMLYWLGSYSLTVNDHIQTASSSAEQAGASIGAGIGITFILIVWGLGAVITGLFALLTRSSKTVVYRN